MGDDTGAAQMPSRHGPVYAGILQGNRWVQWLLLGEAGEIPQPGADQLSREDLTLDGVAPVLRHQVEAAENHGFIEAVAAQPPSATIEVDNPASAIDVSEADENQRLTGTQRLG